jgi:hypothetical protein
VVFSSANGKAVCSMKLHSLYDTRNLWIDSHEKPVEYQDQRND